MTYVCEVVFGRLGAAAIEGYNACGQCSGSGRVPGVLDAGELRPCMRCEGTRRASRSGYAYAHDEPVSVGDLVIVPANQYNGAEQLATVTRADSSYEGRLSSLLRVEQRAADRTDLHQPEPATEGESS
jgi:hypothetical protein